MKKIFSLFLAFVLAITTFSGTVFASESIVPYTGFYIPVKVEFYTGKIVVTQDFKTGAIDGKTDGTVVPEITGGADLVEFTEHIVLGEPDGRPYVFNAKGDYTPDEKYGKIYMYDYIPEIVDEQNSADFEELVTEIKTTPEKYINELNGDDIDELAKAWKDAFYTTFSTDNNTVIRYNVSMQNLYNMRETSDFVDNDGWLRNGIFNLNDVHEYNYAKLLHDIYNAAYDDYAVNSYYVYLNEEYARITPKISYEVKPEVIEEYEEKLTKLNSYPKSDYTDEGWATVSEYKELAYSVANKARFTKEWESAVELLDSALAVRGKPVSFGMLQDTLIMLFVGEGTSVVKPANGVYLGNDNSKYTYNVNDFTENGVVCDEWLNFAGDENGMVNGEYSAFTKAYNLWKKVRASLTSAKQSEVDSTLCELEKAIADLDRKLTYTVSGTVTAFGDESDYITIELLTLDGTLFDTATIRGNSGKFTFENVPYGTYKARVSKPMHCTREYPVIPHYDIPYDYFTILLYGDVTGDGVVNNTDVIQINRKIVNLSSVFDTIEDRDGHYFNVTNVTAIADTDAVINNADVIQINRKIANMSSVFDRL